MDLDEVNDGDEEKDFEEEKEGFDENDVGEAGGKDDCLGSRTGLCSVPYQIICHLCSKPCPGLGLLSGPILSISSDQVPAAFSPQKWTDRNGHWSNLDPKVSLGLGNKRVDLEPDGEVNTNIKFPLGT